MKKIMCVIRGGMEKCVQHAMDELENQIKARGIVISFARYWDAAEKDDLLLVIGEAGEALVQRVFTENRLSAPCGAETAAIHSVKAGNGNKAVLVSGGDPIGLMYAVYELADRFRCAGLETLTEDIHVDEKPENHVRGVDRFIMNHLDEAWFHSSDFWDYFLGRLARNRFNRFTLITAFDTAYMTPPYPYFTVVPGYENVQVIGLTAEKREQNLERLRDIARKCHEYGLLFSFAVWQQKPWTKNQKPLVEGMPQDDADFIRYCAGGMDGILKNCPGIDVVQLRVNHEAGVSKKGNGPTNTHELFWNTMIDTIAGIGRPLKLDLRAKGVTDGMIAHALAKGLDITIPTKYWCEHAALPYHISKLRSEEISSRQDMNYSRRYSYGDLLKKPRWYDVIYRLWNYGSTNLFLWADPDYCARFSKSIRMGGGIGFEINSPLALKGGMEDHADKPWSVFRDPELAAAQWEDERYWAYYLVFGRYGYSSRVKYETILREFTLRFGAEGAGILDLYESAGKILPLITTVHFPVHPSLQYWPELYPGAALFAKNNYDRSFGEVTYASALPSDEELFYGIAEYAEDQAAGRVKAKYSPLLIRNKLHTLAHKVRSLLAACGCSENSRGEKRALWVDFTMTALLADFHAWKSAAAYHLYRYQKKPGLDALKAAYGEAVNARGIWAELSGLGSRYYHHDLQFNAGWGEGRHKNWQERLEKEVDLDIKDLEALLAEAGESPAEFRQGLSSAYYSLENPAAITLRGQVPAEWHTGEDLKLAVHADGDGTIREIFLNYRHMDHTEGEYLHVPMKKEGAEYTGVIPADYFSGLYDVILYFSALDTEGRAVIYPGIDSRDFAAPYFVIDIINAGETRKQP